MKTALRDLKKKKKKKQEVELDEMKEQNILVKICYTCNER